MNWELKYFIGNLATVISILTFATGLPVIRKVMKRGTANDVATFPYVAMLVSCALWLKYGLLTDIQAVQLVNLTGVILQMLTILVFYTYSTNKFVIRRQISGAMFFILTTLFVIEHIKAEDNIKTVTSWLGIICSCLTVTSYASPLTAVGDVLSSKTTASMNFTLITANVSVGFLWSYYGYLLQDSYLMVPNMLGHCLALVQLSLFCIYPHEKQTTPPNSSVVSMGVV